VRFKEVYVYIYINLCYSLFANDNSSLKEPTEHGISTNEDLLYSEVNVDNAHPISGVPLSMEEEMEAQRL
jgi:hypothetical protein